VSYHGDTRRFKIDAKKFSFESFCQLLQNLLGLKLEWNNIILSWKDDENDDIVLSNEIEWQEAVRATLTSQKQLLKLQILDKNSIRSVNPQAKIQNLYANRHRFVTSENCEQLISPSFLFNSLSFD
jgi:hypothetical protein